MEQIIKDTRFLYALSVFAAAILIVSLFFQESTSFNKKQHEVRTVKKATFEQMVVNGFSFKSNLV
ncbi:MAG TPA: hypothetical protein VEC36_08190 [Patescibacteria group bacterium]|nr:hypothetical protein [Patescibacteria group bacterium]